MRERRHALARRSAAEWAVRGSIAAVIAITAYAGITRTAAYALRSTNVDGAHALAPGDGRITALAAQKLLEAGSVPTARPRIEALARDALRQDPTAVAAASTLGLTAEIAGRTVQARRLMAYAQKLSRRDLQTQLWAIEDAVRRNDIPGALRHYDIALRTSRNAPDLLFPVLGAALADTAVRAELTKTLAARPPWLTTFTDQVAGSAPDQRAVADLFIAIGRAGIGVSQGAQAAVVDSLTAKGELAAAWTYYRTLRPAVDRRRSRDPRFRAMLDAPTPFDWTPVNDAGVTSSIQRGEEGGIFDFAASSTVGSALLRQRQLLPPGTYRLTGHSIGIDQPADSRPYWSLVCQDGREVGRVELANSSVAGGRFAGRFTVPAGCPVQTLTLTAKPSDAIAGSTGQIDHVQLGPMT